MHVCTALTDGHVRKQPSAARCGRVLKLLRQRARDISTWTTRSARQWPLRTIPPGGSGVWVRRSTCSWPVGRSVGLGLSALPRVCMRACVRALTRRERAHPRPRHAFLATRSLEYPSGIKGERRALGSSFFQIKTRLDDIAAFPSASCPPMSAHVSYAPL